MVQIYKQDIILIIIFIFEDELLLLSFFEVFSHDRWLFTGN